MKNLYLDLHVLQTLPPSNINRDDTGSPKTALYGGVRRARVSSQAWKRAMRKYFVDHAEFSNLGVRSMNIVQLVVKKVLEFAPEIDVEDARKRVDIALNTAGVETKDLKTKALFFISDAQAEEIAKLVLTNENPSKKDMMEILQANQSLDIALFGRMVAKDPSLNVDASSQVAHALSTHSVETEYDFFTGLDDLASENNAGAGMLGTIEYNSSVVYRYANIAIHELAQQLKVDGTTLAKHLNLFIEAFVKSMPTGKSNTFANQTIPSYILVTLREDRPINLVTAFEKPIKSNGGHLDKSVIALEEEYERALGVVESPIFSQVVDLTGKTSSEFLDKRQATLVGLETELGDFIKEIYPFEGE